MDLKENFLSLVSFHSTLSFISITSLFSCIAKGNLSTTSTSQSLKGLEKRGFQSPPPHPKSPNTPLPMPLLKPLRHTKRGKNHIEHRSRTHLSFQNLTLLPFPTKNIVLLSNKDPSFLISFHNPTPYPSLISRVHHPPSSSLNFLLISCF